MLLEMISRKLLPRNPLFQVESFVRLIVLCFSVDLLGEA